MQGARATQICHSLTAAPADGPAGLASVSALTDQRDNQTYAIARLADGSCWMIENLRLDAEHTRSAQDIALSAGYNTDATFGNFLGLANSEDTNFANSVAANSIYYSGTQSGTASVNIGTNNLPGFRMPRYSRYNVVNRASVPTSNNGVMYSYGNYYSWPATIASTSYYDTENVVIDTSICPYNWRIPSGGRVTNNVNVTGYLDTYTDFYYLGYSIMGFTAYEDTPNNGYSHYDVRTNANGDLGSAAFRKYPNNYVYSGGMMDSGNEINGRGEMGYYWTSTTRTANNANGTYVIPESVNPGTSNLEKFSGAAVRCLLNLSYGGA